MRAFYSDQFVLPLPQGHRFPMGKYRILRDRLAVEIPAIQTNVAQPATDGELALAHAPTYIQAVEQGTLGDKAQREIGFPWSPEMVARSRRSTGATIMAARAALFGHEGIAANLAGGTHHAYADKGSGFCVFNDAAVATRLMQSEWSRQHRYPLKVAIIDLDVHQGNGTASIFTNDPSVFTLSLHGEKNFPFRKVPSDLDVGLPDGCTDAPYLDTLDQALKQASERFKPDFLIYLAGADAHEGDRLGRLKLSEAGMAARDQAVFDWASAKQVPMIICMGGGYGHDLVTTVAVQMNTWRLALRHWLHWQNRG